MKKIVVVFCLCFVAVSFAAIPTEEGLLKNLNNSAPQVGQTILRLKVSGNDGLKIDAYYKLILSNENPNAIQVLQLKYAGSQMSASQLKDVKYDADLFARIKKEVVSEKTIFYSALSFLVFNKGLGLETIIDKTGGAVLKTRGLYNEEKMRLLRQYKGYLANSKSKSDSDSPLNPADAKDKQRVQELFRANSLRSSPNVKLAKIGSSFMWHADWKNVQAYFSNEERRLKNLEITNSESTIKLELDQYGILNGINEFPKTLVLQGKDGIVYKVQVLGVESKVSKEKTLVAKYEEAKKITEASLSKEDTENFLFP